MKKIIKWFNDRRDRRLREKLACKGLSTNSGWLQAYDFIINPIPEARTLITRLLAWRDRIPTLVPEIMELVDKRTNEYRAQQYNAEHEQKVAEYKKKKAEARENGAN